MSHKRGCSSCVCRQSGIEEQEHIARQCLVASQRAESQERHKKLGQLAGGSFGSQPRMESLRDRLYMSRVASPVHSPEPRTDSRASDAPPPQPQQHQYPTGLDEHQPSGLDPELDALLQLPVDWMEADADGAMAAQASSSLTAHSSLNGGLNGPPDAASGFSGTRVWTAPMDDQGEASAGLLEEQSSSVRLVTRIPESGLQHEERAAAPPRPLLLPGRPRVWQQWPPSEQKPLWMC